MEWLIGILGLTPKDVFALFAGALICLGVTQAGKRAFPMSHRGKQVLAFAVGAFATYTLIDPLGLQFGWDKLWMGAMIGLLTPTFFRIFKIIAEKRGWEWARVL